MFVIPCKYNATFPFVQQLVRSIREFHPDDKIVVVDSDSADKSYFADLRQYDVIIEDVGNRHWMVGAYWHAYKKFSHEDFYFFMHDSMIVKSNLDFIKQDDLTLLMFFERERGNFDLWGEKITNESDYEYRYGGYGCYGPIFFCKNHVMQHMLNMGVDKFLPSNKQETWYCERAYGFFFEEQGYDLTKCTLYGNVFDNEGPDGRSGPPPHKTSWQYPVEKFYASHVDPVRR